MHRGGAVKPFFFFFLPYLTVYLRRLSIVMPGGLRLSEVTLKAAFTCGTRHSGGVLRTLSASSRR